MKFIFFIYQWLIAFPTLLIATVLTALVTTIGCKIGNGNFWGYYPGRCWSRLFCIISCVKIKVQGRENIQKNTSYVFVANHQGAYDIFLIYGYLGHNFKWMMKKSLRTIPFVGSACEAAGFIFVDRSGPKGIRDTLEFAGKTLQDGMSLVVFPEGSRSKDGELQPFKKGAFQLAVDLNLPVVPITISGSYDVMPRNSYQIRPGTMHMIIHKPIIPPCEAQHEMSSLIDESYSAIEEGLESLKK